MVHQGLSQRSYTLYEGEDVNYKVDTYRFRRDQLANYCSWIVENSEILPEQKLVLKQYYIENRSELAMTTLSNKIKALYYLCRYLKKPFSLMTKTDIIDYIYYLEDTKKQAKNTIAVTKITLMSFFKWLLKTDKPEITAWMGVVKTKCKLRSPEELLSIEDIQALINATTQDTKGYRNRCIIMMLYETGLRSEELTGIKIGDIKDSGNYIEITIKNSKTEQRVVFAVKVMPYLRQWLEIHPYKNKPESYLFISTGRYSGRGLHPAGITWKIKDIANRAGIKKRVSAHLFRHTAAQNDSNNGFSEKDLRYKFGWSKDSNMTSNYTRPDLNEIRRKTLQLHGIESMIDNKQDIERLMPKICPNCRKENTPTQFYCSCGMPLTANIVSKDREAQDTMVNLLTKYPELAGLVKELLKKELKGETNEKNS